jgi:hypothetical protein
MDEEMPFPNPVSRTDLPQRRRWKRYILAGVALTGFLIVAFLPQVLHNRIGRRLLRARMEMKYDAEISMETFTTSWFGGTSATQVWLKSAEGRVIGLNTFKSEGLSLGKLLRGKFDLGKCTIDGLIVDFAFDNADAGHTDTYEKLTGAPPRSAGSPPAPLARLSGQITLTNAQLNLYRCNVDPRSLNPVYQATRFTNISGDFDIAALDKPWKYSVEGDVGVNGGGERGQTFKSSGTICLGEGGSLVPGAVRADARLDGQNVPTDLVAVLLPLINGEDCRASLGTSFDQLTATLKGEGGALKLGVTASSPRAQICLQPAFDLKPFPPTATIAASNDPADNTLTAALPPPGSALLRSVACINPFAADTTSGVVALRIHTMTLPIGKTWPLGSVRADLEIRDAKLATIPAHAGTAEQSPRSLGRQLAVVSGDLSAGPAMQTPPVAFTMDGGTITLSSPAVPFKVGDTTVTLSGTGTVEGALKMKLGVSSAKLGVAVPELANRLPMVEMPLLGTVDQPRLDMTAAAQALKPPADRKLHEWTSAQLAALRSRDAEAGLSEQETKLRDTLKPFTATEPNK